MIMDKCCARDCKVNDETLVDRNADSIKVFIMKG